MSDRTADTSVTIHPLIAQRWSPRAFDPQPPPEAAVQALLEAARWSPSAFNLQPWRFVVWQRERDPAAFQLAFNALIPFNQAWVENTRLLIGVFAQTLNAKGERNPTAAYDTGAAALALVLQAEALGLSAHQMSGFDPQALRSGFSIPEDVEILSVIAIGQRGDAAILDDTLRQRETAPRKRLPLAEIAYRGEWLRPYERGPSTDAVSAPSSGAGGNGSSG